jgi:hypothetical protein
MSRTTILLSAPLGLGALVLLWAAMAARSAPAAAPARPASKAAPERKAAALETPADARPASRPLAAPAPPVGGGGETALIEGRIRMMEERLLSLEAKRTDLSTANQGLERQILEKNAELTARMMAEARVRGWEQMLGLSESQKQTLLDLVTRWQREDAGKAPGRDTWLEREVDLRSVLSAEQASKLHEASVAQGQTLWKHVSLMIGNMVGASKDDQTRFQQLLGDFRPSNAMLLPEGYGADWPSMMKDATARLQPVLSPDQMSKLNRFVQR